MSNSSLPSIFRLRPSGIEALERLNRRTAYFTARMSGVSAVEASLRYEPHIVRGTE